MAEVIGKLKFNAKGLREVLGGDAVKAELMGRGGRIADSMNAEGHGEFRAFAGTRGKRARVFVNAYDAHAKNAANKDPAIFARNVRGGGA